MKTHVIFGILILIAALSFGLWYNYHRDYYRPSGLSDILITYKNGITRISFSEMPESVYFASGAQVVDENDSQITVSIVREHIQWSRKAQYPTQGNLASGHYVDIPNPNNKVCLIK